MECYSELKTVNGRHNVCNENGTDKKLDNLEFTALTRHSLHSFIRIKVALV